MNFLNLRVPVARGGGRIAFWIARKGPQGPSLAPEDKRLIFYAVMAGWVSLATFVVSATGTASTIVLGWPADRRQVAEAKLKIAQLQLELFEARQKHALKAGEQTN
ncbi:hypothetical protein [Bradyrhizobium sp. CCBAU 53338]|uniref:hypothetical protein n=1 Tax=Bradyrhizobium sp. CCBAU 53338 TaxID=1325111 RepID=UPI001889C3D6|nr:hypothetical protein [Bradyrhizobium sp. CCBAU 53338]QOZ51632.1 hypothetical protein XH90_09715 [Bradyrhizobium sp. CCBAU 53338]